MHSKAKIINLLKERLTEKRYIHSINVAVRAVELASIYSEDTEKAELAGLVHDICKYIPENEMLKYIVDGGIVLDEVSMRYSKIWHAFAASVYIQTDLDIHDADIINAVKYHTTGRSCMSNLEKIIYLADLTSKDRKYDGIEKMVMVCNKSLNLGMIEAMQYITCDLVENYAPIALDTYNAYNEFMRIKNEMIK